MRHKWETEIIAMSWRNHRSLGYENHLLLEGESSRLVVFGCFPWLNNIDSICCEFDGKSSLDSTVYERSIIYDVVSIRILTTGTLVQSDLLKGCRKNQTASSAASSSHHGRLSSRILEVGRCLELTRTDVARLSEASERAERDEWMSEAVVVRTRRPIVLDDVRRRPRNIN